MDGWEKLKASPEQSRGNEVGYRCTCSRNLFLTKATGWRDWGAFLVEHRASRTAATSRQAVAQFIDQELHRFASLLHDQVAIG